MNKSFDFLVGVARKYYIDEMSQSEIAELYKISRPTVANILKECREKGIVEIRINGSSPYTSETGSALKDLYGLETVCIVANETDYPLTLYKTCLEAALFLSSILEDNMHIGISWGTALYHTIRQLPKAGRVDCEVVQLMGGLGASALFYDGAELARILFYPPASEDGNPEWLIITPDGCYDASPGGNRYVNVRDGSCNVHAVDEYHSRFYRPDIVRQRLQGSRIEGGSR